jgi:hypothetical protein
VSYVPEPEGPGRLAKQLALFARALACVRGKNAVGEEEYTVLYRLVADTIHANKYRLLFLLGSQRLMEEEGAQTPAVLQRKSGFPQSVVYRYLEELSAFGLANKNGRGGWSLSPEWREAWERMAPTEARTTL